MKTHSLLEPLEARIAPAILLNPTTVVYTEADGDVVTVKTTAGTFDLSQFTFAPEGNGERLLQLNLGGDQDFRGANLSIVAQNGGGDGFTKITKIDATGVDLGNVTVDGDLTRLLAGDASLGTPGVKTLRAHSLGLVAPGLPVDDESPTETDIVGNLGALVVDGDLKGASVHATGNIGRIQIGGSVLAGPYGGDLVAGGSIGTVKIGGSVVGGGGTYLPPIPGQIITFLGGRILAGGDIGSVKIGGSVTGSIFRHTGTIEADGKVGSISIGGDLVGFDSASHVGAIEVGGNLGKLTIGGSIIGKAADTVDVTHNGGVFVGGKLGQFRVRNFIYSGDIEGVGSLSYSGCVVADAIGRGRIDGTVFAGSLHGTGSFEATGSIVAHKTIGSLRIGEDLRGGQGSHAGIYVGAFSGDGNGVSNVVLKNLSIGGDVVRANIVAGVEPGNLLLANTEVQIGTVRVGGDWSLSNLSVGATRGMDGDFGTIDDDLFGHAPLHTGVVSSIAKITIKGQVSGSLLDLDDSYGFVAERIGAFSANGVKLKLTKGANSLGDFDLVPGASDVRVAELSQINI